MTRRSRNIISHPVIDALEPRRMLAVFNGTSGNDEIKVTNQAGNAASIITINGANFVTSDTSITINAGAGNDLFRIFRVRAGTTVLVRGDAGNDTLLDDGISLDLDNIFLGDLTFDGGSGTDNVVADNSNDAAHSIVMSMTGSAVSKGSDPLISYDNVESVEYWDSNNDSFIAFYDMHTGLDNVALEINAAGGNDFIYNAFSNWDTAIGTGGVQIDAGAGVDTLQLSNTATTTNRYQFVGNTINGSLSGTGTGGITYFGTENLNFIGGSHNETILVNSKTSTTAPNVDGGSGNDNFTIGNNDFDDSGLLTSNTTVVGGAGNDSMTIQDQADTDSAGEVENYNWFTTTLSKGLAGFNYSDFENQTLVAANGVVPGQFNTIPQVNLNSIAISMGQTSVGGGNARGCIVNVGAGNLTNINGDVFLNLAGTGFDQINFYHDLSNVNTLFRIGYSQLVAPRTINFTNAATVNIHAGAQHDTFFVDGSAPGTSVVLNGNLGNDVLHLGGGNVGANLHGPVTFNGASGNNETIIDNTTDATLSTQAINGNVFTDGQSHTFNSQSRLVVNGGPGGSNMAVSTAGGHFTEIHGDNGDDHFDVGGGDIDANMLAGTSLALSITGGGGTDSIRFDDTNDTVLGNVSIQRPALVDQMLTDNCFVNWSGIESATFDANNAEYPGSGASHMFIVVLACATPLTINGNGGPDSIQVQDANFPVVVDTGPGDWDSLVSNADLDATPGDIILRQDDSVRDLILFTGGKLTLTNGAVLNHTGDIPGRLKIDGVLDIAGGALLHSGGGTPLDFFQTRLTRGHAGGAWNGTHPSGAIHSSLAASTGVSDGVGFGLGSQIAPATIGPFSIAAGDILLRYTLDGDADLNGQVNLLDFNRLTTNFNGANKIWTDGDFTYDGAVNLIDFNALAGNFNQAASAASVATFSRVPIDGSSRLTHLFPELA